MAVGDLHQVGTLASKAGKAAITANGMLPWTAKRINEDEKGKGKGVLV
jgi:hypothetical protein